MWVLILILSFALLVLVINAASEAYIENKSDREYHKWLKLRADSEDEYGEKLCYCGHTYKCTCSDPDKKLFEESVARGALNPNDPQNDWSETEL